MDFQSLIQVAAMKQSSVDKKQSPRSKDKKRKPSNDAVKAFLKKQEEEERRKAEEAKKKKLELLKLRVEANNQRKANAMSNTTKENVKLFDMTEDDEKQLKSQNSEEFDSLKHTDFVKKNDRQARTPNAAAIAARQKLEAIKNKMKGTNMSDRMAEIDAELSEDEKEEKVKPKIKGKGPPAEEWTSDKHKKDRSSKRKSDHKDKERHKDSSKHKHKHKDKDRDRDRDRDKERRKEKDKDRERQKEKSHSSHKEKDKKKEESKPFKSSGTKYYVEPQVSCDSDSDISDISSDDRSSKPKSKAPGWVSVGRSKPPPEEKPRPKIKPRAFKNLGPPPMSFMELLQVAQKKQTDPGSVKESSDAPIKKKKEDRPMTQEEKEREARRNTKEYQDWIKYGKPRPSTQNKSVVKPFQNLATKPKPTNGESFSPKHESHKSKYSSSSNHRESYSDSPKNGMRPEKHSKYSSNGRTESRDSGVKSTKSKPSKSRSDSPDVENDLMEKLRKHEEMMKKQQEEAAKLMKMIEQQKKMKEQKEKERVSSSKSAKSNSLSSLRPGASYGGGSSSKGDRASLGKRPKHSISDDEEPVRKKKVMAEAHVNPWDRIYSKIQAKKPKVKRKPAEDDFIDDAPLSDEYDSELDDFIDDGEDEEDMNTNYSKHIRSIFGYDKRKFRNERDEDLRGMEASFSQITKEEARSARLGMQEDLEDIRREEEELKRMKAKKKRR